MKRENDPLKTLFDAFLEDVEPIDPEGEAEAIERFFQGRVYQTVEGEKPRLKYVDPDMEDVKRQKSPPLVEGEKLPLAEGEKPASPSEPFSDKRSSGKRKKYDANEAS